MHQILLDVIKFNRIGDKAKLKVNFNFNAKNKKLKGNKLKVKEDLNFEIHNV
jgi:hypothetical protein